MLRFNSNKKFKIMQITDIQEIPNISADTLKLLNAALDSEHPDLVVLTGDQIKGYGISYKSKADIVDTIKKIMAPITDRGIPFAVTFGNHDCQVGMTNRQQLDEIYSTLPNYVHGENVFDAGSFNVPIYFHNSDNAAFNLFLMYSGTDKKGGGYEPVSREQIEWFKAVNKKVGASAILFQHIPLCEYYNLLERVSRFKEGAVRAYRTHKNQYFVLKKTTTGHFLEPPSIPDVNTGEFDAISESDNVLGVFVGHDHKNDFVGKYKNVTMGFTPSAGFNEYGNGLMRGVRVIELDENNLKSFNTRVVTYKDLGFKHLEKPIKDYIYRKFPATVDAAIILFRNIALIIAAIAALFAILHKFNII